MDTLTKVGLSPGIYVALRDGDYTQKALMNAAMDFSILNLKLVQAREALRLATTIVPTDHWARTALLELYDETAP